MSKSYSKDFKVNGKFHISKFETNYNGSISKKEGKKILKKEQDTLWDLQEKLYADGSKSVLIVIQAMDAAGKDSLIDHVFGGINPQGCEVTSFKTPSAKDYSHDFLWRHYIALPAKGKIGIFNRSHYESVLICKVHPDYNLNEKVWNNTADFDKEFWKQRYESIRNFEKHLAENGTKIIKFFLNVSKVEQKQRFLDRINEEDKNWKFGLGDLTERVLWDDYQKAYEDAINETSKDYAPWYILPADNKWFTRLAALQIINENLEEMNLNFPVLSDADLKELKAAKESLNKEK